MLRESHAASQCEGDKPEAGIILLDHQAAENGRNAYSISRTEPDRFALDPLTSLRGFCLHSIPGGAVAGRAPSEYTNVYLNASFSRARHFGCRILRAIPNSPKKNLAP